MTASKQEAAFSAAFDLVAHIGRVMSAHATDSDLARVSQAVSGEVLTLDPHTVHVLRAAQYWQRVSQGAFNPTWAAAHLSAAGRRPGLASLHEITSSLHMLEVLSDTTIKLQQPIQLDLGGIAKGYAVDCAITSLQAHGVVSALVNAGGDMRAIGGTKWPVDVRHSDQSLMDKSLRVCNALQHKALATSVGAPMNSEFVSVRRFRRQRWRSVTVQAADCMTADALTKWALQSSLLCPQLRSVLHAHQARMWRSL